MIDLIAFVTACCASDTFSYKVDRNLMRPYRNFKGKMHDYKFLTPEDMGGYIGEQVRGIGRMFIIEDPKNF